MLCWDRRSKPDLSRDPICQATPNPAVLISLPLYHVLSAGVSMATIRSMIPVIQINPDNDTSMVFDYPDADIVLRSHDE